MSMKSLVELVKRYPLGSRWWVETVGDMLIEVELTDLRDNFGRVDIEVRPLHGRGTAWVNAERLKERADGDEGEVEVPGDDPG